ncbi:barstar family protein [Streptomyces sp. NPDC014882]|uniref:barstar family protein n=1 Tax=Streptomyces sp. NPDC014882 TaxID=3364927 RepID=UPI0036F54A3D
MCFPARPSPPSRHRRSLLRTAGHPTRSGRYRDDAARGHAGPRRDHGQGGSDGPRRPCPGPPERFGRNGDALADSLADPGVRPAGCAGRGLLVLVRGRPPYARENAREWAIAEEVFAQAADRTPELSVALALGGAPGA